MNSYTVKKYDSSDYLLWNTFVASAKNATFLFHRDFMEYHHHKFEDFSLLIFDDKQKVIALLPANRVGDTLFSHQGLTYGGLVLNQKTKLHEVIEITFHLLKFLAENTISKLHLKIIPPIYNHFPSDEMEYLSFILQAKLVRRDILSVLDFGTDYKFSKIRKRGINNGVKNELIVKEENIFEPFWNKILIPNLEKKYQAKPVHSLEEITYLNSKFPNNIRQFNVYKDDEIVAGTTIFEFENVAHSQYISGNKKFNNEYGGLDFLYYKLLFEVYKNKKYFDLGPSTINNSTQINQGLQYWKESFGARTVVQNFYEIETQNYSLLENVLL